MNISVLRSAIPSLLLSALILIPFLNKAFTIDDPLFLFQARHAIVDPLHPTAFVMAWDLVPERVSQLVPSGPVMAWLLMPAVLSDKPELVAHATQLILLWFAILSTISLARRLELPEPWPTATGLILVAMPAVIGMSGTAMPDVAAMTLGVAGIERLMAWSQNRRISQSLTAAVLLGFAPLARPHLILLICVGGVFLVGPAFSFAALPKRRLSFLPLVSAALITVAVFMITSDPNPGAGSLISSAIRYSLISMERLAMNLIAFPTHWVLAMAFALPWLALRWQTMRNPLVLAAGVIGALASAICLAYASRLSIPISISAGLGIAVLVDLLSDAINRRDSVQLALGLWLLIALPAALYLHFPPKYLVASAPAAALLIARELASRSGKERRLVPGVTVTLGIFLGIAILCADATFSNMGRRAAAELIAPNVAAGKKVWFVGHWGFQWYAENAGARPVTLTPPYPSSGDLIVASTVSVPSERILQMIGSQSKNCAYVTRIEDSRPGGRVMDKDLGAGFYSSFFGYWPWGWGDTLIERFTVWRLE